MSGEAGSGIGPKEEQILVDHAEGGIQRHWTRPST
jgi:hypothetical protein